MLGKALVRGLLAVAVVATAVAAQAELITHGSTTINMAFVNVGNPGNAADTASDSGNPAGQGAVGYAYRIGTYDVTAAQWAAVIAADPNVGSAGCWSGSQPVADVSWNEAAMFCNWLTTGNADSGYYSIVGGSATPNALSHNAYAALYGTTYFLPTEDEWYKAAYYDPNKPGGAGYWLYPTGSNTAPTAVYGGTAAGTAVFNGNGVYPSATANVDNAGGLSPYGTMGQGGNVYQWNEALVDTTYGNRGMRGGSFFYGSLYLASSERGAGNPTGDDSLIGFRVASVPEPGSISLLVAAAITALICWRRWR
jgi:formylglycine-generating enzyme required for sulfatase activity